MKDMKWFEDMEARIPHGEVRTRFAPSPTGYMHVGNLRTALYLDLKRLPSLFQLVKIPLPDVMRRLAFQR